MGGRIWSQSLQDSLEGTADTSAREWDFCEEYVSGANKRDSQQSPQRYHIKHEEIILKKVS